MGEPWGALNRDHVALALQVAGSVEVAGEAVARMEEYVATGAMEAPSNLRARLAEVRRMAEVEARRSASPAGGVP
jgi:hypothetical protein